MLALGLLAASLLVGWLAYRLIRLPLGLDESLVSKTTGRRIEPAAEVSVLIPVRNEEAKIEACLRSVFAQTHPIARVVVVNDGSTDRTPEILQRCQREFGADRLHVCNVDQTPAGWTGKNWAMNVGAEWAKSDWVLQIDGDVRLAVDALDRSLEYARGQSCSLISLLSTILVESVVERLFQSTTPIFALLFNNLSEVNDPASPKMFVNGQFILYRRGDFEAVGGYPAIRAEVADDVALGRLLQQRGYRVQLLFGQEYVETRMYEDLRGIWNGWSKFLYNGLFLTPQNVVMCVARILGIFVVPPVVMLGSLVAVMLGNGGGAMAAGLLLASASFCSFTYFAWRNLCIELRARKPIAIGYPIAALFFIALLVHSSRRIALGKGIEWKGRQYFTPEVQADEL